MEQIEKWTKMKLLGATGRRSVERILFLLIFVASFSVAHAQVKVGDNPNVINADAVLDIESTNKGLLLPRVALTGTTNVAPLTAHVEGMAVYNTATAGDVTPGYYFNDGTKWVALADAAEADQQLGTHDQTLTTNRTVTTGNFDLNFDANTLVVDGSANEVGIGTATPDAPLDVFGNAIIGDGTGDNNKLTFRRLDGNTIGTIGTASGTNNIFEFNNFSGGGSLIFNTNSSAYTGSTAYTINNNGSTTTTGGAVINEQGLDQNFRVEGDTEQNLIFGDAGTNRVGIGTATPDAPLDVFGSAIIGNTSDDNSLIFRRFNGATAGEMGYLTGSNLDFRIRNGSGAGFFSFQTNSPSYTGDVAFSINNNGSTTTTGGAIINEQGLDQNFRVEGDTQPNLIFGDAGTNRVGIGTNSPNATLDVPGGAHISTTRIQGNTVDIAQDAAGDRSSSLRFYSDTDGANDAEILREPGVNGNLVIDNEGSGMSYLRNRGSGEIRLGTNNSDDLTIQNGGQVRLSNLPAAADTDQPVQADATGNLKRGYRAGEVIAMTVVSSFTTQVLDGGDIVNISTTYTPRSNNSTILVTYDCDYTMQGFGGDTWYSYLYIDNLSTEVTEKRQLWRDENGGGTRSGTLLPILGSRANANTTTKNIRVTVRDIGGSANDEIVITPNNGTMVITEIAN